MLPFKIAEIAPLNDIETTSFLTGGTGRSTVFDLISAGELDAVKLGRSTKVTGESIIRFVERLPRLTDENKVNTRKQTLASLAVRGRKAKVEAA